MAKLDRKHQKIFADLGYTGNLGQFGSYASGSPTYTDNVETMQALSAWGSGIGAALVNSAPPALQDMDGIGYLITKQLSYLFQSGIPEYSALTNYTIGSLVNAADGSIYMSQANDNLNQALSVETKWMLLNSGKIRVDANSVITPAYDDYMIIATMPSGTYPVLVFLPTAVSTNKGRMIIVKRETTGGNIQVQADSGTIDGSATNVLSSNYVTRRYLSDGTNWLVI